MKKIISSIALAALFAAGVADVEAIGGRSSIKTALGHNNGDTVAALQGYANSTADAQQGRMIITNIANALTLLRTNPTFGDVANQAIGCLEPIGIALESIENKRKIDDIQPDCTDAIQAAGRLIAALIELHRLGANTQDIVACLVQWPIAPATINAVTDAVARFYNTLRTEVARFQSILYAPTAEQLAAQRALAEEAALVARQKQEAAAAAAAQQQAAAYRVGTPR
ncbi:MAG: hypothetical protein LBT63_00875 [Holosporaceae bacterium]|jgi:hypothetical protein|nr:hypothetical protein [Holosporaceae bacterium]